MEVKNGVLIKVYDRDIDENGYFDSFDGIKKIASNAFSYCSALKKIEIPSSVTSIGAYAFYNCENLSSVTIYGNIKKIESNTFADCESLYNVNLPDSIVEIDASSFENCRELDNIFFPKKLKTIGDSAFEGCESLYHVTIPSSVDSLGERAFYGCSRLTTVRLSNKLREINKETFSECTSLEDIMIPENVELILEKAFYNCENLREMVFPKKVESIGNKSFANSGLLRIIFDGDNIDTNKSFSGCENLESIEINGEVNFDVDDFSMCDSIEKIIVNGEPFKLKDIKNYIYETRIGEIINFLSKGQAKSIANSDIKWPLHALKYVDEDLMSKIFDKNSTKFFKEIYTNYKDQFEKMSLKDISSLYKFAIYLGCFNNEICSINNSKTNIAQKSCDFLQRIISSGIIKLDEFGEYFSDLKVTKYNPMFINFITQRVRVDDKQIYSNFEHLINYKSKLCDILNNFDDIANKKIILNDIGRTNNHPTTKAKIDSYVYFPTYHSMREEDKELAEKLSCYLNIKAEHFENARRIVNASKKATSHILGEPLKEDIERLRESIRQEISESKDNLDKVFENEFTYEWLDKHDLDNLILGAYCDCCATIAGKTPYGISILEAAMTDDDVQNLVIKNLNGEIIAKATIYVNRKYGYAVFNDIEINIKYGNERFENDYSDGAIREKIYLTFKRGVYDFVKKYNSINDVKITQVNVGWGNNKLKQTIKRIEKCKGNNLKPLDFFKDAEEEQWTIYKK